MQALGLIETRGLLPAIECADVMLKTAQVELVERTYVGGGLVTITVTGEVGAVKAAVEAGVAAVEKIGHRSLVTQHIIPRPHQEIENLFRVRANPVAELSIPVSQQEKSNFVWDSDPTINLNDPSPNKDKATEFLKPTETAKESSNSEQIKLTQPRKEEVDAFINEYGLEKCIDALKLLSVVNLRNLARDYLELGISGRAISKANKESLIQKLKVYYERVSQK